MFQENSTLSDVILVIDDEPFVLNAVCQVLAHAGFTVLRAESPLEALLVAADHTGPIRLMVCDVVLPCLSGPTLVERISQFHPESQCLFIAGLPDNREVAEQVLNRGREFLPKPFFPQTLLRKVNEMLGIPRQAAAAV